MLFCKFVSYTANMWWVFSSLFLDGRLSVTLNVWWWAHIRVYEAHAIMTFFKEYDISWRSGCDWKFLQGNPAIYQNGHCDHLYILCVPILRLLATPWAVPESFLNWDSISWLTSVLFFMSGSKTSLLLGIPDVKAWSVPILCNWDFQWGSWNWYRLERRNPEHYLCSR